MSLRTLSLALCLFCALGPAWGQHSRRKPPVIPTNGKPPAVLLPNTPKQNKLIARVLMQRLRNDRRLDASRIRVTASGPRIGLYGSVPDYYQRRIASQLAQSMEGVTYVANHLRLVSPAPTPEALAASVRRALAGNPATAGAHIRVQGYRSVVTLTATVPTLYVKRTAIRLAKAIPHIAVVQDHLQVAPGGTGEALAASVKTALSRDPVLRHRTFHVLVRGSHIYLRGAVYSQAEKKRAGDVASRVPGVQGLSNEPAVLSKNIQRYNRRLHRRPGR